MEEQVPTRPVTAIWVLSQPNFELGLNDARCGKPFDWRNSSWQYERGRMFGHIAPLNMPLRIGGKVNPQAISGTSWAEQEQFGDAVRAILRFNTKSIARLIGGSSFDQLDSAAKLLLDVAEAQNPDPACLNGRQNDVHDYFGRIRVWISRAADHLSAADRDILRELVIEELKSLVPEVEAA
jgi:hypothetical protein